MGFSVHGILQARVLEWVAMPSSRAGLPTQELDLCLLCLLHWQAGPLPLVPPGKPQATNTTLLNLRVRRRWKEPLYFRISTLQCDINNFKSITVKFSKLMRKCWVVLSIFNRIYLMEIYIITFIFNNSSILTIGLQTSYKLNNKLWKSG